MKKLFGIFTNVRNLSVFLPIWIDYYSKQVPMLDLWILDDNSIDGCTDGLNCNVIKCLKYLYTHDHIHITKIVNDMQLILLQKYLYIMYAESDAIIKHLDYDKLTDYVLYLKSNNIGNIRCNGMLIWHNRDLELPLDVNNSILSQRKYWFKNPGYSTPAISNYYLDYQLCFHEARNMNNVIDLKLLYVHLHRFDYDLHMKRKLFFKSIANHIDDPGWGWQNKLNNEKLIHDFFMNTNSTITEIPNLIRLMKFI